jgi:hypothetical protein
MTQLPLFDPATVKVLSIRQPWAWLILTGHKSIENRTWNTHYRGPLYIHAGINMHDRPIEDIERQFKIKIDRNAMPMGAIIGRVDLVDVVMRSTSSWFEGPVGFVLRNPEIIKPVPYRGRQGLFDVPASVVTEQRS